MLSREWRLVVCAAGLGWACSQDPSITDKGSGSNAGSSGSGNGSGGSGSQAKGGSSGSSGSNGTGGSNGIGMLGPSPFPTGTGGSSAPRPDGSSNPGTGVPDKGSCGFQNFMLERLSPEILIVLDRSSSMNRPATGATGTLWTNTTAALDEVVRNTQDKVLWGLKMFPNPGGCIVPTTVEVAVAPTNHLPVVGSMMRMGYNMTGDGGTPTSDAVRRGLAYLKTLTSKNAKYIVLATDGEPNCANGAMSAQARPEAIAAIREAVTAGFKAFVIGIAVGAAGSTGSMTLNEMAVAGGAPRPDPMFKYYPVANRAELVASLEKITVAVSSCEFQLEKKPPAPMDVAVDVAGMRIKEDGMSGWTYGANMMSIELHGEICEKVKAGAANQVKITFGCPGFVIP